MKKKKIMAEQNNGKDALYNSHKDRWSRKAKHQIPLAEKHIVGDIWTKGEWALYENSPVEILVETNENMLTGIKINNKVKMVNSTKLTKIDESAMGGLISLNPLNRMMQLAGISTPFNIESKEPETLKEADATNMFNSLMKANQAGEYKNNPEAAALATVGQILTGLSNVIEQLRDTVDASLMTKLDTAVGLGAFLIKTAKEKTKVVK